MFRSCQNSVSMCFIYKLRCIKYDGVSEVRDPTINSGCLKKKIVVEPYRTKV